MYGLVIEGVRFMIQENWGTQVLDQVQKMTLLSEKSISTHDQYSEHVVPQMFKAIHEITGTPYEQIGVLAGRFFVQFLIRNGYGDLMNVMGRRFSDFIKGLDNIHEYFRFSYPKLRAPSFYCQSESEDGLILHYRSRRTGYLSYVIGQLVELARVFYHLNIGIQVLKKKEKGKFQFVVMKINFENIGLNLDVRLRERVKNLNEYLPVDTRSFLRMFPFHISFNKKLEIIMMGQGLHNIMPNSQGLLMTDIFDLQRPCIKFTAEGIIVHQNCVFQVESLHPVIKKSENENILVKINDVTEDKVSLEKKTVTDNDYESLPYVILRGPIIYLKTCDTFLFLATCVVDTLDAMFKMGLYLNDFGESDCNREIIMSTIQKSDTLKQMLENEKRRSQVLTEMTKEISEAKRKTRKLLSQMMPFEVAKQMMRSGNVEHCEAFECVSIGFIRVCDFAKISLSIEAFDVVNLLNTLYSILDEIVDLHGVYKIETIGEAYMISAGCPYRDDGDAEMIADCCLEMIQAVKNFEYPNLENVKKVQVKIGIFSGPVVGGVVGVRTPRYCLFGDTVNTASRMESSNKTPMTIQIGQRTRDRLEKHNSGAFRIKPKGSATIKGKGVMKVYEVEKKKGRARYKKVEPIRKRVIEEKAKADDELMDEDMDGHRGSALSRMSLAESEDSSGSRRGSLSASQLELNKTIAHTIEITSRAASILDMNNMQDENNRPAWSSSHSDERLNKKIKKSESKLTLSSRISTSELASSRSFEPKEEDTPRPTTDEMEQMQKAQSGNLESVREVEEKETVIQKEEVEEEESEPVNVAEADSISAVLDMVEASETASFAEIPSDSIPQDVRVALPDPEEAEKMVKRVSISSVSSVEEDTRPAKKITAKPTSKSRESKESVSQLSRNPSRKQRCRCDDIRADSKLKTKVCTIM
ncbi:unnamed protein product [Caenorhabditis angaria]|uniref:guanylate cyclase n=1 Tax=Caenorhabditis angaria TaxID=860376 RepID=A0A9P1IWE9_9PELO|nr:unnamed protein product [Caenorhabditis angaria]